MDTSANRVRQGYVHPFPTIREEVHADNDAGQSLVAAAFQEEAEGTVASGRRCTADDCRGFGAAVGDLALTRYYRNQRIARIDLGVGLGGLGAVIVGTTVLIGAVSVDSDELAMGGVAVGAVGSLGLLAGGPIMLAGSMSARGNQRDLGVRTPGTAGWIGLGLAVGGLTLTIPRGTWAFGGMMFAGSCVAAGFQLAANSLTMDAMGQSRVGALGVRPVIDPFNKRVLLVATF